jgi:peptidoglycan/LPS O-acetylase OafA/YrhL
MTTHIPAAKQPLFRIDEFDGLRGILALWVALIHIISWCGLAPLAFAIPDIGKRLWNESAQGAVDVFIILSGFVITHLLHSRPQSYRQFMIGRFFRIYPVYLVCLLLSLPAIAMMSSLLYHAPWHNTPYFQAWLSPTVTAQSAHPISHFIAHLTLLFGLIPEKIMPSASTAILGPAWSITLEWQYYLVAPLLARLVFYRSGFLLLGLIGAGDFIFSHFWSASFLPLRLPLFLIGIGSYHFYIRARLWSLTPQFTSLLLAIILATIFSVSWHWMALSVWAVVLGCLIPNAHGHQNHDGLEQVLGQLQRLLLKPVLQGLGRISYPVYLIHWPMIIFLMVGLLHWQPQITPINALLLMLGIGLPIILLSAFLLHLFVEVPLMKFGKKFKFCFKIVQFKTN